MIDWNRSCKNSYSESYVSWARSFYPSFLPDYAILQDWGHVCSVFEYGHPWRKL